MRPSEVFLNGGAGFPFPQTFEEPDLAITVAMIVCACAMYGDTWQPVTSPMIMLSVGKNVRARREPWQSLEVNRTATNPNFYKLAEKGYARFTQSDKSRSPIELTSKTLDILRRLWWRPNEARQVNQFGPRATEVRGREPYEPPAITEVASPEKDRS